MYCSREYQASTRLSQQYEKSTSNPDYDVTLKRLYLLYIVKLLTFSINDEMNLIVQFLVFIQPYIKKNNLFL